MRSPPKQLEYYGTTQLERRSRSPSPTSSYATPFRRLAARFTGGRASRRLPPVPPPASSYPDVIDIEDAGIHYPSELEQRSRSPSPSASVYSMSEYFRRPRLRRLPPAPGPGDGTGGIFPSECDRDPFATTIGPIGPTGRSSSSCFGMLTPGLPTPLLRPPSATAAISSSYPQSVHLLDTDPLSIPSYHEAIQLPTLSHSPTIPHPETRSPTAINFPRVSSSPTHGATPNNNSDGLLA